MCGRFSFDPDTVEDDVRRLLDGVCKDQRRLPFKTGEICPTDTAAVLVRNKEGLEVRPMVWGLPKWDGKGVIINARAETALSKPMFAKPLRERRAVIPTSGFFEWQAVAGQKKKNKYLFREPGRDALYLAGFWNAVPAPEGREDRFCILTTAANAAMEPYHNRMPALLHADECEAWLDEGLQVRKFLERVPFNVAASEE